jgi:hypothetical protein
MSDSKKIFVVGLVLWLGVLGAAILSARLSM